MAGAVNHSQHFRAVVSGDVVENVLKPPQPYRAHIAIDDAVQPGIALDVFENFTQTVGKLLAEAREDSLQFVVDALDVCDRRGAEDDRLTHGLAPSWARASRHGTPPSGFASASASR